MTHRIFIGLQLPETLQQQLGAWRMDHAQWPVRWTRATDLHLTVVAPWEVESLQPVINTFHTLNGFVQPQTIPFDRIHFVPTEAPRMLWLEGDSTPELTDMKQRLHSLFEQPAEDKPFRPHLTLARCWADDVQAIKDTKEAVQWPITCGALVLYESRRDNFGSRYKVLASIAA